jgi:ABC-type ATPase involved in cell division
LDEALGLEFSVGVGDGGAMNTEHLREFAAGGNAVARPKVTSVNQGAKLIAKLNVEGNVAFRLKVYWQHCLSP